MSLPDFPRRLRALLWLGVGLLGNHANAENLSASPLVLRSSSLLQEGISQDTRKKLPTFVQSDTLNERANQQTTLEGNVVLRRGEILLKADRVDYDQVEDLARARGNVYINQAGNVYQGPELDIRLDSFEGFFTQPSYRLFKSNAYGSADRIDFVDNAKTVMHNASFTTCQRKPGPDWMPDWFFKGDQISIDTDRNTGLVEGASESAKLSKILIS